MLTFLAIALFFVQDSKCLKEVVLKAPEAVRAGSSLQLICQYDLEGAPLYSVKFYQGEKEFYRFVPGESPPTRVFPLPGLAVNIFQSNSTLVTLTNVHIGMTSFYGCEVSADAPLFHTEIKSAPVIITEEPRSLPSVTVEKTKYALGERVRANCTSVGGYPPANLSWFINGKKIKPWEGWSKYDYNEPIGQSEIEFIARSSFFHKGKLKLRCQATQFTLYRRTAEVEINEDSPRLARILGPTVSSLSDRVINSGAPRWLFLSFVILLSHFRPDKL